MAGVKPKHPIVGKIRAAAEKRELTHQECADQIGVSLTTLRAWFYGIRKPSPMAVRVIQSWLENSK